MKIDEFPMCCNAYILTDFGGTRITAGEKMERTTEQFITDLGTWIQHYGHKCLTAFTNNEQTNVNAALEACGFECSDWMEKRQHPETKIRLWWRKPDI